MEMEEEIRRRVTALAQDGAAQRQGAVFRMVRLLALQECRELVNVLAETGVLTPAQQEAVHQRLERRYYEIQSQNEPEQP